LARTALVRPHGANGTASIQITTEPARSIACLIACSKICELSAYVKIARKVGKTRA
jgi:hypothetical protein